MKQKIIPHLLFAAILSAPVQSSALKIMTEEYPPYNYKNTNGKLTGISVDILLEVWNVMGENKSISDIKLLPWGRSYHLAQSPDIKNMLFSMTRTSSREDLFKWVGPIIDSTISIFAYRDSNIIITNPMNLKKYRYAQIRSGIGAILLAENKTPEKNIVLVNDFKNVLKRISDKRMNIDLFAYEQNSALFLINKFGYKPSDFKIVYSFKPSKSLYFAFNRSVDNKVIARYQNSLNKVLRSDEFLRKIADKYKLFLSPTQYRKLNKKDS